MMIGKASRTCQIIVAIAVAAFCVSVGSFSACAAVTERLSTAADGTEGDGPSGYAGVTSDARFIVFESSASNLVPGDSNGASDIFLRDRSTGTVILISVSTGGVKGNGGSYMPVISPDGRHIAYHSDATNLVADDTNGCTDVFFHDCVTGITERVSVSTAEAQGNGDSKVATLTYGGQYVAFQSEATSLVSGDSNGVSDVFLRDRFGGTTIRLSSNGVGQAGNAASGEPFVNCYGTAVVYSSYASDVVAGDANGVKDVFFYAIDSGATSLISVSSTGEQALSDCKEPRMTVDGRYVAFRTRSPNMVASDTNVKYDIFVRDMTSGMLERVSVSSTGAQTNGCSFEPCLSIDGRYISFRSLATNLVPGDTNGKIDAFVRDRIAGTTERVSVSTTGEQADADCNGIRISCFGRFVIFFSEASSLVPDDGNGTSDTFIRDRLGSGYNYPDNVSLTGNVGSSSASIVTATYMDSNGYADVRKCYLLINDSLAQSSAVFLYYDRPSNRVYLKNDAGTSWGTGYAPGSGAVLQNSQCYVYLSSSEAAGSDKSLALSISIRLKDSFAAKLLNGYLYVQDFGGRTDGWEQMSSFYNVKPEALSVAPSTGQLPTDKWLTLTSYYRDANGWQDLRKCYLLVNTALSQADSAFLWYDKSANKVYLLNDSNTSWGTGATLGADTVLENSQCQIDVRTTSAAGKDNSLAISWSILLKSAAMDGKNLYSWVYSTDSKAAYSGYKKVGTHFTPVAPDCMSLSPNTGTVNVSVETPFTAQYEDPNGWADIYKTYIQLSVTSSQANAVLLLYDAKQNKVFLRNDANTSWGTGGTPGSATVLQNSQCSIDLASLALPSPVSDTRLQVVWPIELKAAMSGTKLCERIYVQDNANLKSGWHVMGYVKVN